MDRGEKLHILPNGIKHDAKVKSVLGNGVVIDPKALLSDFGHLSNNGIDFAGRLTISERASIVTNLHKSIADKLRGLRQNGVWLKGEDMTQAFKPMKLGLRMALLVGPWSEFEEKYHQVRRASEELFRVNMS